MLGAAMLGTSPKHWAAIIFCAIPFLSFFAFFHRPTPWSSTVTNKFPKLSKPWSSTALAVQDTKDLADQHDIFDSTLEGGARIRQACMLISSQDTAHQMGANVVYERSVRTHLKHAEKWGYPSHILRDDIIGQGKWEVLAFGKLLYLQSIIVAELTKPMGKRAEWIVYVEEFDADTIILNENIPWSIFLPPREDFNDIHFLGNKDWYSFNCGVFMMRINEWSVNFLSEAIALPLLRPDIPLGVPIPNMEQDAIRWVLDQKGYKEHAVYQPRLWYNAFSHGENGELEAKAGDMLIHFPGVEHKYPLMGHWLDIVENEPEKVNIPLANLTLQKDIKGFWANLRNAKQALHNATEYMEADIVLQRVFYEHPELDDDLKEAFKKLERLVYEEPFHQKELKEATLLVEETLSRASFLYTLGNEQDTVKIPTDNISPSTKAATSAAHSAIPSTTIAQNEPRRAFVTFLEADTGTNRGDQVDGTNPDNEDTYFVATRVPGYQLMHQPETRSNTSIPYVVVVSEEVSQSKRARLEKDGAKVVVVDPISEPEWLDTTRQYQGVMTKLRVFQQTEYEKMLYMDADMLLTRRMDEIFEDEGTRIQQPKEFVDTQNETAPLPPSFLLAGQAQQTNRVHGYPPDASLDWMCSGFMVFKPSQEIFEYYSSIMERENSFDPMFPDQNLLNYAHRWDGPMPWTNVYYKWNSTYPTIKEYAMGAAALHEKYWVDYNRVEEEGQNILGDMWLKVKSDMEAFYRDNDR